MQLVETQDICCVESEVMRFVQSQYNGSGLQVLALKTAHAVRFKKADILALNEAHVCVSTIRYAQWSAPRKRNRYQRVAEDL